MAGAKIAFADIRPTEIIPTGLTLSDTTTGKTLKCTISNMASYVDTDEIVLALNDGTVVGCFSKADYVAAGNFGYTWPVLTNGTNYQLKARATSDNFTFSEYSALATAATPTAPASAGSSTVFNGFFN
jgi:hypothetical protein